MVEFQFGFALRCAALAGLSQCMVLVLKFVHRATYLCSQGNILVLVFAISLLAYIYIMMNVVAVCACVLEGPKTPCLHTLFVCAPG
jgi:hypothetical protein